MGIDEFKFHIITRTCKRPKGFEINYQSVLNQSDVKVEHHVLVDDLKNSQYVLKYPNINLIEVDKKQMQHFSIPPNVFDFRREFIYNLYLNVAFEKITDGWVMILDDDDYLKKKDSLLTILKSVSNKQQIPVFKTINPIGKTLPIKNDMKNFQYGQISSQCYAFHSSFLKKAKWDGFKGGDYRFFQQLIQQGGEILNINEVLTGRGNISGEGKCLDVLNNAKPF